MEINTILGKGTTFKEKRLKKNKALIEIYMKMCDVKYEEYAFIPCITTSDI
jgi:hypothetical protein